MYRVLHTVLGLVARPPLLLPGLPGICRTVGKARFAGEFHLNHNVRIELDAAFEWFLQVGCRHVVYIHVCCLVDPKKHNDPTFESTVDIPESGQPRQVWVRAPAATGRHIGWAANPVRVGCWQRDVDGRKLGQSIAQLASFVLT